MSNPHSQVSRPEGDGATSQAEALAPLVGASKSLIARAVKRRAEIWPLIAAITDANMRPVRGRLIRFEVDPAMQAKKQRLATINSAAWWLERRSDDLQWSVLNAVEFGTPPGAVLPRDWYEPAQIAERERKAKDAQCTAQFLGLPALKGTSRQAAWGSTIRDKFRKYCEDCLLADSFMGVAKSKDAASASFWIDRRTELDFKEMLTRASDAAS